MWHTCHNQLDYWLELFITTEYSTTPVPCCNCRSSSIFEWYELLLFLYLHFTVFIYLNIISYPNFQQFIKMIRCPFQFYFSRYRIVSMSLSVYVFLLLFFIMYFCKYSGELPSYIFWINCNVLSVILCLTLNQLRVFSISFTFIPVFLAGKYF